MDMHTWPQTIAIDCNSSSATESNTLIVDPFLRMAGDQKIGGNKTDDLKLPDISKPAPNLSHAGLSKSDTNLSNGAPSSRVNCIETSSSSSPNTPRPHLVQQNSKRTSSPTTLTIPTAAHKFSGTPKSTEYLAPSVFSSIKEQNSLVPSSNAISGQKQLPQHTPISSVPASSLAVSFGVIKPYGLCSSNTTPFNLEHKALPLEPASNARPSFSAPPQAVNSEKCSIPQAISLSSNIYPSGLHQPAAANPLQRITSAHSGINAEFSSPLLEPFSPSKSQDTKSKVDASPVAPLFSPSSPVFGSYSSTSLFTDTFSTMTTLSAPFPSIRQPLTSAVVASPNTNAGPKSTIRPPPTSMLGPSPIVTVGFPTRSIPAFSPISTSIQASSVVSSSPVSILRPSLGFMIRPSPTPMSALSVSPIATPITSLLTPPIPNIGSIPGPSASTFRQPATSMMGPSLTPTIGPPPTFMLGPPVSAIRLSPTSSSPNSKMRLSATASGVRSPILPDGNVSVMAPIAQTIPPPPLTMMGGSPSAKSNSGVATQASPQIRQLSQQLGGLSVTKDGWNRGWGSSSADLLQNKIVIPPEGIVPPKPTLMQEYLPNCSPDIFRCTISKVPESQSVLQKSRLPFGLVIHPFKDLDHISVVTCNTIVRCRSCRTYINPFVVFKGERRWECNLCYRVNDLPDEFRFDPVTRTYGDPSRRPEVREATLEFIAPQEYMLRPPQSAAYVWVLDVSRQAIETGYLKMVCDLLLSFLDKIPGDKRTLIGFITFSATVQFYLLNEGTERIDMLEVGDVDNVFIPTADNLLVNLGENRALVEELLVSLPETHAYTVHTQTAFGAALTAAFKLISHIGGRITAMTAVLPTVGPGTLKSREDPNERSSKEIGNLGPATDFYKKFALDCSGQQVAVDLFTFSSQYIDLATLTGISRFSGGSIYHFPAFHLSKNPLSVEPFKSCLTRYITRKIGFEAVMRIRATRGIAITNFHGNFFVRSTDLLSLPNINPDAGFAVQLSIEEPLHNIKQACFQAALLYTSSKGERRIRVHTLCLPVSANVHEIILTGDQQAIASLLAKMAVDRCLSSKMADAREAIVNACTDILCAYKMSLCTGPSGGLLTPPSLQVLPLYLLALLKSVSLRHGVSTKLDDRIFAMCQLKTLPLKYLIQTLYPDLYPIHNISEKGALSIDDCIVPQPSRLHLSAEHIDRSGAYLLDSPSVIYVYVRSGISREWVNDVLGVPSYEAIPQPLFEDPFPSLDTSLSEMVRSFILYLQRDKPFPVPIYVIREDNPGRSLFIQHLVDDRSEGLYSYVEFLQFIRSQMK